MCAGAEHSARVYSQGEAVWYYRARYGVHLRAHVSYVDASVQPPAYQVTTVDDPQVFDTEALRLRPRTEENESEDEAAAEADEVESATTFASGVSFF